MPIFGDEGDYYRDMEIERARKKARHERLQQVEALSRWLSKDELELLKEVAHLEERSSGQVSSSGGGPFVFLFGFVLFGMWVAAMFVGLLRLGLLGHL